jgi:hypothetical protein
MRSALRLTVTSWAAMSAGIAWMAHTPSPQPKPRAGDGIFTPIIRPVTTIDKTGRPITVDASAPEPAFASTSVAGTATGDSYVIHFPTGDVGGPCVYTGQARYVIESTGDLSFQMVAKCGQLMRGYGYMICRLDETLHCAEAPWWNFRARTYAVTDRGVVVDGAKTYAWQDPAHIQRELQTTTTRILKLRSLAQPAPQATQRRYIMCRAYRPAAHSYEIHEFATNCVASVACSNMPDVTAIRDGDRLDLDSPAGRYVRRQSGGTDMSNWVCWLRTQ